MKIVSLLAGVAAVAMLSTAASAQDINKGQNSVSELNFLNGGYTLLNASNLANANDGNAVLSSWHAVGDADGNIGGNGSSSDGATFTMTGSVSTDCAYYSGTNNTETLDFGQIGIYTSDDAGPAAAFTMVDDAYVNIDTNLAGCNTANTVRLAKTNVNGLVSDNTGGFDSAEFQNNLPYSVTARYVAAAANTTAVGTNQTLVLTTALPNITRTHGAWKSAMSLDVEIPQAAKALVAGNYSGTFSVTISAGI